MKNARRALPLLAATVAGTVLLVTGALRAQAAPLRVVVTDRLGGEIAAVPLGPDGRFAITYQHSVYLAPARERFVAEPGGFRMLGVSSPNDAVLDYYDLDGTRALHQDWWHLDLATPVRFEELPLVATATGQRTLIVGDHRIELFAPGGPRHLRLTVTGAGRWSGPADRDSASPARLQAGY